MTERVIEIHPGAIVWMHLTLTLADGTEALSTFGEEPLRVVIGSGSLKEGMELALMGLKAGDEQTLTLEPDQAYGWHDPERVQNMSMGDFPPKLTPQVGQVLGFTLPDNKETSGMIVAIDGDKVMVDFNHPLAGKALKYYVKILQVADKPL